MSNFKPLILLAKFQSSKVLLKRFRDEAENLKEKYRFERFEIDNDGVSFSKGIPFVRCGVSEETFSLAVLDYIEHPAINEIIKLFEIVGYPLDQSIMIRKVGVLNFLVFNEGSSIADFIMCTEGTQNICDEIKDAKLNIGFSKNQVDYELEIASIDGTTGASLEMIEPIKAQNADELTNKLEQVKNNCVEIMNAFLETRIRNFKFIDGELMDDASSD